MRVSTLMTHQVAVRTMTSQEGKMLHTMQQISTGRRVLTPADDPLSAALAVNVAQTQSMNSRYAENRDIARQNLSAEENTLSAVSNMLQDVLTRIVEAGNEAFSDADRRILADVLSEMRETLLGLANATDGTGRYLFSGDHAEVAPYDPNTGALLNPDMKGSRNVQVAQTRVMPTASTAVEVFHRPPPGTQAFVIEADPNNSGTVTFGRLEIVDVAALAPSETITISFAPSGDPSQPWNLVVEADGNVLPGYPRPYAPGEEFTFNGLRVRFDGEPNASDVFTVQSATVDLFADLDRVIQTLGSPISGNPPAVAALRNDLATANRKINLVLDNVLTVRASIGARINELEALDGEGMHRHLNYEAHLSSLEDLDYRAASSDLAVRTMALQAAELAYMKVQGLGLFARR